MCPGCRLHRSRTSLSVLVDFRVFACDSTWCGGRSMPDYIIPSNNNNFSLQRKPIFLCSWQNERIEQKTKRRKKRFLFFSKLWHSVNYFLRGNNNRRAVNGNYFAFSKSERQHQRAKRWIHFYRVDANLMLRWPICNRIIARCTFAQVKHTIFIELNSSQHPWTAHKGKLSKWNWK